MEINENNSREYKYLYNISQSLIGEEAKEQLFGNRNLWGNEIRFDRSKKVENRFEVLYIPNEAKGPEIKGFNMEITSKKIKSLDKVLNKIITKEEAISIRVIKFPNNSAYTIYTKPE